MQTIRQALDSLLPAFRPLGVERVPFLAATGRVAADDVMARRDMPAFDNSAMDGYAVRLEDLRDASETHPVTLRVAGESRAGGPLPGELETGTALRIFTGASMPAGADAVVMQEDVARDELRAVFRSPVRSGQHVRRRASDLATGAVLVPRGTTIGPGEIGALVSQGYATVSVARRPRVTVLATGDELRDVGEPLGAGDVANSNAYMIAAQVAEAGGEPVVLPIARDDRDALARAVRDGLRADLLVTCGGVSVGEHDHVKEAFAAEGVELTFWKVAMKPGKPLAFGKARDGAPVVGLPGNPVSSFVTFELFVRPGIRKMLGDPRPFRPVVRVTLSTEQRRQPGRTEIVRARLARRDDGEIVAHLRGSQGSGSIPSLVDVDALVVLPAAAAVIAAGSTLDALLVGERWRAGEPTGL